MARRLFSRIPLLAAALLVLLPVPGMAQSLPVLSLPSSAPAAVNLGNGIKQDGLYWTAPITVDGVPLLRIATPANVGSEQVTIEARQQAIQAQIVAILAMNPPPKTGTVLDPDSLQVSVHLVSDYALLSVDDAHTRQAIPLLTVTAVDAKYQKQPVATLADTWAQKLQDALRAALLKRQPAEVQRSLSQLWQIVLGLIAVTLVAILILIFLNRRMKALREEIEAGARQRDAGASADPENPGASRQRMRFMGLAIRASAPEMSLRALRAFAGILLWGTALLWFLAIVWGLQLFPQTTQWAHVLRRRTTLVVLTVVGAMVLIRLADILVSRGIRTWAENSITGHGEERARMLLRIPTIASAASAFNSVVIFFFALLVVMGIVGIPIGQVLTLGGIAALGVTFAAQSLLRDFLNGVFVLFEDQYVIGDYVIVDQWSGVVENMTLRVVQLRDSSGSLITIPHGQVTQVVNCSRNWSRVDYRVPVDARADVDKAIDVLKSTLTGLAAEKQFGEWLLDPVELVGVDSVSGSGIVLRASIKTAPLRQFELKREINRRVIERFRDAGIALGVDPRTLPTLSINQGPS